jgi:ribosomal protein S25
MTGIPKIGKHISLTNVVDKFKVIGSVARILLKRL